MVLRISGENLELGEALRTRINETVADTVAKYFNGGFSGQVTVSKSGRAFATDCALHLDTGMIFEARGADNDPHLSFDQAARSLEKRLRRYKRRLKDHKGRAQAAGDRAEATAGTAYVVAAPEDEEIAENYAPAIIAETQLDIPTLSVAAAVMQLDRLEAPVVIFRNPSHGGVNVVYRRLDGHFGWVDPALADAAARTDGGRSIGNGGTGR